MPDIFKPNEEINAIKRSMAGPYCYDLSTPSPEFELGVRSGVYKSLCTAMRLRAPFSLMPHIAMLYYHGAKFPELEGELLISLHGYRPNPQRVLVYDVDDHGFQSPARCATTSVARPIRPTAFRPTPATSPPRSTS